MLRKIHKIVQQKEENEEKINKILSHWSFQWRSFLSSWRTRPRSNLIMNNINNFFFVIYLILNSFDSFYTPDWTISILNNLQMSSVIWTVLLQIIQNTSDESPTEYELMKRREVHVSRAGHVWNIFLIDEFANASTIVRFGATRARGIVMPVHALNKPSFRFVNDTLRISIDLINVTYWHLIVLLVSSRYRSIMVIILARINRNNAVRILTRRWRNVRFFQFLIINCQVILRSSFPLQRRLLSLACVSWNIKAPIDVCFATISWNSILSTMVQWAIQHLDSTLICRDRSWSEYKLNWIISRDIANCRGR